MICSRCRAENEPDARFCEQCIPVLEALLAGAHFKHGRIAGGLETVEKALREANLDGMRRWETELLRLRGEGLFADRRADAAEVAFRDALAVARSQGTKSWELRSAVSLSRLWQRLGKREEQRSS